MPEPLENNIKRLFLTKYSAIGEDRFYQFLISYGLENLGHIENIDKGDASKQINSPEIEFMEFYDKFLLLYRREGEDIYLKIAKNFRRAAHQIYRVMLKKKIVNKNTKFLNLVG